VTPEQTRLARHALGLPNDARRSYRNRFAVGDGPKADLWRALVSDGLAVDAGKEGTLNWFHLTRAGAEAALNRRETLCPEDFPTAQAA
jgi:hypothetical protein